MNLNVNEEVLNAKRENESELLAYPNVQSVGVGHKNDTTEECIVVGVSKKVQEYRLDEEDIIPSEVDGVKTDVQEVGEIVPEVVAEEEEPQVDRTARHRPVPQGVSVAHPDVTAGTSGWIYKTDDGSIYLGSNNHVLANSNNGSVGDNSLQPGPYDGGVNPDDAIGTLAFYVPIEDNVNVDLAIALMSADHDNSLAGIDKPITGVVSSLAVGDELVKSGRTTGVTRNTIEQLDATVNVGYGGDLGTITVTGCILTGDMSEGGDSGSPTAKEMSGELKAAGRLFAGSSSITVHHHIDNELTHLNNFDSTIQLLTATEVPTANVTLTLTEKQNKMGNIEALVTDGAGTPLGSATVDISGPISDSGTTNTDGIVVFKDVPIDAYSIVGTKTGYNEDSVDIVSSDFN